MKKVFLILLMLVISQYFFSCEKKVEDEYEIRTVIYKDSQWGKSAYVEEDGNYTLGKTYKTKISKLSNALNLFNEVEEFNFVNNILTYKTNLYPDIIVISKGHTITPDISQFILSRGDVVLIIIVS